MTKLLLLFVLFSLACSTVPPDVQARIDFAMQKYNSSPFPRVAYSARGAQRTVLEISVLQEVPFSQASRTVALLVSDRTKTEAKALGFERIDIRGGKSGTLDSYTINQSFDLQD